MATQTRSSGLFSGLVLLSVGILLLLHNYGHLGLQEFFGHWWPLIIIFWGAVKLYERTVGRRFGRGDGGRITGGEVLLVLGMLALLGAVVGVDYTKEKVGGMMEMGDTYSFDVDVAPVKTPANARVLVHNGGGDISVRGSDENEIRVTAKKAARSWSESEAGRMAKPVDVVISQNGDGFEVHPAGYDLADSRISVDLEVAVPQKASLSVKTDKGDVTVSGISADVSVTSGTGDVDVRGTTGAVDVEMRKGDAKISDTKGDVKISGKGGEIEVTDATGGLTVDGDFYGPVRADKVLKGVRLISMKTDMTLSALTGHLEAGSGNLDIADAPGNLTLRTRDCEINVDNPGGKMNLDNRNGNINVRYSSTPKEDVQINNSSSEIALTLPGSASFEITADCHNCDIDSEFPGLTATKSEAGDSHLAGKYGNAKGPKISLKTSYGNISIRRTSMAMPPRPPSVTAPNPPEPPHVVPPSTEQ
jgi:DUF4097 and DUF4098 domain-containing protein YvlB